MNLEIVGKKPSKTSHEIPILFIHGMWQGAWCWADNFLPYFTDHGYMAYALSLRGHGSSGGRDRLRWTSLDEYVEDIAQVVNQMEKIPILVGHSMGGTIVRKYLVSHPVPAAVLLAPGTPKGIFKASLRVARRHPQAFLKSLFNMNPFHVVATSALSLEFLFSEHIPAQHLNKYQGCLQDESFRAYLEMMWNIPPRKTLNPTPILVIGGENDVAQSKREVESTAIAYGTHAEILPEVSHSMMLETKWQSVADFILAWLRKNGL